MGRRGKISSSSSRGGGRSAKLVEKDEEDRISKLSDDLINHILSYVHCDVAVQTMVLSKRWLNLWTTLSCLNFKSPIFGNYENFVRKFLINRDHRYVVSKFSVNCHLGGNKILPICLGYAVSHKVEHLSIRNGDLADYTRLRNFACIKTLHVISCENLHVMKQYWTFPSATSLYLKGVSIGKIQGFRNLKELTVVLNPRKESDSVSHTIIITCPKLERLTLSLNCRSRFTVATPILSYLNYRSRHVSDFSATDGFHCIKQVYIDIWNRCDFFDYPKGTAGVKLAMQKFISMLKAVSETPFLELSSETIQGLRMVPNLSEYEHSSLGKLKFISLRGPGLFDLRPLMTTYHVINYLLTNSPCAETIRRL